VAVLLAFMLLLYLGASYLLMPAYWKHYSRRHPALRDLPGITHTGSGIPADPLNVALFGTRAEVLKIMIAAKWDPADPLTFRSCLGIATATVLRRPYADAPVSNLYLWGRKEDLAFEQPVGRDPKQRHHVRLDICTPVLDGWGFLQEFGRLPQRPPVLLLAPGVPTREWAADHGCAGLVRQPIDTGELLAEVQRCLGD
jgi:CheY-like chemotaxis protein